jgi:hypothetical protein
MLKKIAMPLMAVLLVFGAMMASVQPAEAGRGGRVAAGVAAGIIGLGLLGAYAHARDREYTRTCYEGPRECYWRDRHCFYNRYGDYVCRGGDRVCNRRTICE